MLPKPSTMSRRLRTYGVRLVLGQIFEQLNELTPAQDLFKRIDAHPLTVGGASKDRDARCGFGAGKLAKGYKLHELRSGNGHIDAWGLTAMADNEKQAAVGLIDQLPPRGGYLVGDSQYDANALYDQAASRGYQLLAPAQKKHRALGHRRHSPHRLRGRSMLDDPMACLGQRPALGPELIRARTAIERDFAHEVTFACGLKHPPFWVRTPHRTSTWVQCKLIIILAWTHRKDLC
jgi:hypothetical protein